MTLTSEMQEILEYLHTKKNYALFAGFAAFLHTGVEPSPDIDVFVSSVDDVKDIADDFTQKGWTPIQHTTNTYFMDTVEKNNTTFDILFSKSAKEVFFPQRVKIYFEDKCLYSISVEALLLTKMNQVASRERSDCKTKRDREVIHMLRKKINVQNLREMLEDLEDSFWTEGYF